MENSPSTSLAEDLSRAFDAENTETPDTSAAPITPATSGDPSTPPAGETGAPTEPAPTTEGQPRNERGQFIPKDAAAAQPAPPAEGTPPAAPQNAQPGQPAEGTPPAAPQNAQPANLPPSTWTPQAKAEWAKLPQVIRDEVKKRELDMQRGIQQYQELARVGDRFSQTVQPFMPMIANEGNDPAQFVQSLLATAYSLRIGTPQERGRIVLNIAQAFGADLSQFMQAQQPQLGADGQPVVDPNQIVSIVERVAQERLAPLTQMQHQFLAHQQQQEQQRERATVSQIEAFRNAVDEKGQPKHIYFDNVRGLMASLIENGDAKTLDDAYVMACRAHPQVAQAFDAQRRQAEEAARLEETRRLAENARRANGVNVDGQGTVAGSAKMTLREELAAQLAAANA